MSATLVSLSSGETFYVAADVEAVADLLRRACSAHNSVQRIGSRFVNHSQVAQLLPVQYVPQIHTPEQLEAEHGVAGD